VSIDARAMELQETVRSLFERWKTDPAKFAAANPKIVVADEANGRTKPAALRSIVEYIMRGTGYDYQIAETLSGDDVFFVGRYDERRVR
jgi:hypothetical protein